MAEYIKRDEALKALLQVSAPTPSESYIVEKCIDKINDVPAAEVAPVRHGYWKQNPNMPTQYSCSVCGRCIEDEQCNPKQVFLYCHCGAKMDKE